MLVGLPPVVFAVVALSWDVELWRVPFDYSLVAPCFLLVCLWTFLHAVLYQSGFGAVAYRDDDPKRLDPYPCNGIHSLVLTAAVAVNAHMLGFDLSLIFRHRLELCAAASILAFLLSLYMYARSFLADDDELGCRGILFDGFPRKNFVRGY